MILENYISISDPARGTVGNHPGRTIFDGEPTFGSGDENGGARGEDHSRGEGEGSGLAPDQGRGGILGGCRAGVMEDLSREEGRIEAA